MFVPQTHDGDKGWVFKLVCPGNAMSITHEHLLLQKNGQLNGNKGFKELCQTRHVYIAYSHENDFITLNRETGKLEETPKDHELGFSRISWPWEILESFLQNNNIHPHWTNVGWNIGLLNHSTGQWSGGVGMIQSDKIDILAVDVFDSFDSVTIANVSHYSPPIRQLKFHWFTRWPQELSPTWNLLYLFPEE